MLYFPLRQLPPFSRVCRSEKKIKQREREREREIFAFRFPIPSQNQQVKQTRNQKDECRVVT